MLSAQLFHQIKKMKLILPLDATVNCHPEGGGGQVDL